MGTMGRAGARREPLGKSIWRWVPRWVLPVVALFGIGTVWLRLRILRMHYAAHQLEQAIAADHRRLETLELRVAALRSPERLAHLARRYGLAPPGPKQRISLAETGTPP